MSDSRKAILNTLYISEKPGKRYVAFLLSLLMVFTIPCEEIIAIGGLGSLTKVIGMLLVVVWLGSVFDAREFRKPHPFLMVSCLFIMWNIATYFWSASIEMTIANFMTYLQMLIMVWIIWDLYSTPKAIRAAMGAYILGAYISIGSISSNYFAGHEAFVGRYTATGFNPNDLSLILALGIPVAWHLAVSESNGGKVLWLRLVNYAYIPVAIVTIILTGSRGSLVAVTPAFLFILLSLRRIHSKLRLLIPMAMVAAIFVLIDLVPELTIHRLSTIFESITTADLEGRVLIWHQAIATFAEHPILGVGSGALPKVIESQRVAHNVFLSILAETGIVGFALFMIILIIAVYEALHQPKWHRLLWLTVLAVWSIGALTHNWETNKPTWLFLSLVVFSGSVFSGRVDRPSAFHSASLDESVGDRIECDDGH